MVWACILGYVAIAVSFYLYITRTAQIEPDLEAERLSSAPTLTMIAGGIETNRKAA